MFKDSIQSFILSYLVLNILNGKYQNKKVESENQLAKKFNCSRLTARFSLNTLANMGVLSAQQGFGYTPTDNAVKIIFPPLSISIQAAKTVLQKHQDTFLNKYYDTKKSFLASCAYTFSNFWLKTIMKLMVWQIDFTQLVLGLNFNFLNFGEYFCSIKQKVYLRREYYVDNTIAFQLSLHHRDMKAFTYYRSNN